MTQHTVTVTTLLAPRHILEVLGLPGPDKPAASLSPANVEGFDLVCPRHGGLLVLGTDSARCVCEP